MDLQLEKMKQMQPEADSPGKLGSKGGVQAFRWDSQPGKPASLKRNEDSGDESQPHEPKVVQLNLKASLMGVHILDDEEQLFFSRQSSMSSMISDKIRSIGAGPLKRDAAPGQPIEQPKAKVDMPFAPQLIPPPSQPLRDNGGPHPQSSGTLFQGNAGGSRLPSGMLYPCPNPGSRPNSCLLNAAHFTFDSNLLAPDLASTSGENNLTERIFKKLVGQSRLHQCSYASDGNPSSSDFNTAAARDESVSPVSTLDCPPSPLSSERSFRAKSKRKSLQSRSEDAVAAQVGSIDPAATPRPKSQLAQYLMSITAMAGDATDDDDLEGPSEVAWLEPEDNPYHPHLPVVEGYTSAHGKRKPTHERWTSNSSSWNLSLVQNPLRTVSTIVSRRQQHHHAAIPGQSLKKGSRRLGKDAIMPISLITSYDGGSRTVRKGRTQSEFNSGRSWWPELGSGRKKSMWTSCSGRLQMEVAAEPDLHEPDMEQANNVNRLQQDAARAKVDEEEFPFDYPINSKFMFEEGDKSQRLSSGDRSTTLHKAVVFSVLDSENEDLQFSDNYHDPEDGSISDSDGSHAFSLDREASASGVLDQPPQWVPTRSFDYVREVVDDIGLSSRALSGFFEVGRSGRFSIDLQRGQKLDKVQHPRTPDVRLRIFKSEKPSRRSILSPCLPFLHRSHKHVPRIQQAPVVASASRRLQPVNSFTARLGPVAENSTFAGQFQFH